jgi:preprotein translocase subunit SecF
MTTEFFNPNSNVNFMGVRRWSVVVSLLLVGISIFSLSTRGLNLALDFTGGTLIEATFEQPAEQQDIIESLKKAGFASPVVQRYDSRNFAIRLKPEASENVKIAESDADNLGARNTALSREVKAALTTEANPVTLKPSVYVGPQVGKDLATGGIVAVVVVLLGIVFYIMIRFEWKFAVATVATELHDVILVLGFFSLTQMDFDLAVLAAILAVDGYSVNDTIVVFDRVRELFKSTRNLSPVEVLNRAVNSTLSRTIMTSLTTLLTVTALFLFGGEALKGFSLALIIGILVGTLSSIYFASPVLLWLGVTKQDLLPKARDDAELHARP